MLYPVPTALKELRGTAQPCRITPNEPDMPGVMDLPVPEWMTEEQRATWEQTLANCPADLLRRADFAVLVQYVIALDLYTRAARQINQDGYTSKGYKGITTVHAAVHVLNSQSVILRQCIQELGFSPASRTRINTQADAGAADDGDEWRQLAMSY